MLHRILAAALLALAAVSPAHAEWYRATSSHFVIYSRQKPDRLLTYATKLEKFDKAVRLLRDMKDPPVGNGNRVTVYVVDDTDAVQDLAQDKSGTLAGFYVGTASGSFAVVPRSTHAVTDWDLKSDTVFFHEYSHHLMMQDLSTPVPEWLVEGFAEFMSTVRFEDDGAVGFGQVPKHRLIPLLEWTQLPAETILAGHYDPKTVGEDESLYGRGWLLTHYLTFEKARKGQLSLYLSRIAEGKDPLESARAAFGDLAQLDKDLDSYLKRPKLDYLRIAGDRLAIGQIRVERASDGMAEVLPLRIKVMTAAAAKAPALAQAVRKVGSEYPQDPFVQDTLAQAELVVRDYGSAIAASDRALTANPQDGDAMVLKGRALSGEAAMASGDKKALLSQARKLFIAANKLDAEDPEPLMRFYYTYVLEGAQPTANAVAALHYASDLAPQDRGLRITSAVQYLRDGKLNEARVALAPIAYDPHGREVSKVAREMMAKIKSGDAKGALALTTSKPDQSGEAKVGSKDGN